MSTSQCSENIWRHVQHEDEAAAGAESLEPAPELRVADLSDAVTQRQICRCSNDDVWYVVAGRGCWMCGCGFPRPEPVETVEPKPVAATAAAANPNREEKKRPELCVFVCVVQ